MSTEAYCGTNLAVRVIPCLDVDGGRVVKGVNFENLRDAGDPVELAAAYDAEGADELTFLDVTASSSGRATMLEVVRRTAEQVFIPLTVGGGVRTVADVDTLLRAGADKVSVNTAAIARPDLLAEMATQFGSQCIVLSVDARTVPAGSAPTPSGWEVTTHGGRRGTGIDDTMLRHKTAVIAATLDRHGPDRSDPLGVLAAVGGLEPAALAGFILGAAAHRVPVIIDGVIAASAALAAAAFAPDAVAAMIAGHRSAEPGASVALAHLGLEPLLDLGMRLGEGSGAVAAVPVVRSAVSVLRDVALLADLLVGLLPEGPPLYPEGELTDAPEEVLVAELIREAALDGVRDELPHSIAVVVEEMLPREDRPEDKPLLDIHANLYVERDSQKGILIGNKGARLKDVGTRARRSIEAMLGTPVYLDLHVKIAKDWQRDPRQLRKLGF